VAGPRNTPRAERRAAPPGRIWRAFEASCPARHQPKRAWEAASQLCAILRGELGDRYDPHRAESVGADKLAITFTLRAAAHADAIRRAGMAAGRLAELLTDNAIGVDVGGLALVVRARSLDPHA
jgi:hypothetical protein